MGLLDLYAAQADTSAPTPLETPPSTLGERLGATAAETFGPGRYFNFEGARRDHWQRSIDDLHGATGESFLNPYGPVTPEEMGRLGNQPAITAERSNKIIEASRMARAAGNENIYDPENIDRYIGEEQQRRSDTAARLVGTGNGIGNFLGGAVISSIEPVNALGFLLPVGRMGTAAASAVGRTWLGEVAKEAGVQAALNASLGAVTEGLDYATKQSTGLETSVVDSLGNVVQQGVFGAILGAGTKGLHLMWTGLPPEVRARAPTEVKDAFRVLENDALYSGDNRLGIDPLLHDRYTANAVDPVLRGRAPTLDDLGHVGSVETPLTGLGTILRERPDQIRVEGLERSQAGVRQLPDSELVPLLRETKPAAFTQLDNIDRRSQELDAREQAVHDRTSQIGTADVADIDTGRRLDAIEADLKQPGLRAAERADLEREREMITSSIDQGGVMTKEVASAREMLFPEARAELEKIAQERAALERERALAQSVFQTEIDQLRARVDKLTPERLATGDTGLETPIVPPTPAAISAAELERQILTRPGEAPPPAVRVYRDLAPKLEGLGYSPTEAKAHAALYAARYEARAARNPEAFSDAWDAYQQAGQGTGVAFQRGGGTTATGETYPQGPIPVTRNLEALTVNKILSPATPPLKAGSRDVQTIARDLMARGQAALKKMGVESGRIEGPAPKTDEIISRAIASEVKAALDRQSRNASDWYTSKVREAMAVASAMHPELAHDPHARFGFTAALAITSQSETVPNNVRLAEPVYAHFKKTGRFPTDVKAGKQQAMNTNFAKLNSLLDELGDGGAREFMHSEWTVRELEAKGYPVGGENKDTRVYGSAILGPKIGQGFFQNLNGNYTPVTMDLWFMRGWGRLTGTLVGLQDLTKQRTRFEAALRDEGRKVPRTHEARVKLAEEIILEHERDFRKNRADYDSGKKGKSELTYAAERYEAGSNGINETPTSGGQREWMRARVERAREILAENDTRLTNADLQAVWWYPEKDLYSKLGGRDSEAINVDYASALRDLARGKGVSDEAIEGAVRALDQRPGPAGGRAADVGGRIEEGGQGRAGVDGGERSLGQGARDDTAGREGRAAAAQGAAEGTTLEQGERGNITFASNQAIIRLFQESDLSTLAHESGHLWLEEMRLDAAHERASPQVKADMQAIRDWLGNKGEALTVEQHEKFARGVETYLREGKAPSGALAQAFEAFKEWLTKLYRQATELRAPISPEMRQVFDRMLATDEQLRPMTPGDLQGALGRAESRRLARESGVIADPDPRFDTTVRETVPAEMTPEQVTQLDRTAQAVLDKPGALGPMKESAVRDLEQADLRAKDAATVMACVMGAPL